jgi:hypothetical protein
MVAPDQIFRINSLGSDIGPQLPNAVKIRGTSAQIYGGCSSRRCNTKIQLLSAFNWMHATYSLLPFRGFSIFSFTTWRQKGFFNTTYIRSPPCNIRFLVSGNGHAHSMGYKGPIRNTR